MSVFGTFLNANTNSIEIGAPKLLGDGTMEIRVIQGERTVMECEVEGDSEITWYNRAFLKALTTLLRYYNEQRLDPYRNPTLLLNADHTQLTIGDTRLMDEGKYQCSAMNDAGSANQTFNLIVGVVPKITEEPRRIIVRKGVTAQIPCEAVGHPEPTISWIQKKHNDAPIAESALLESFFERKRHLSGEHIRRRGNELVILRADESLAGVYTCKAENWAGHVFKDVELVVLSTFLVIEAKQFLLSQFQFHQRYIQRR